MTITIPNIESLPPDHHLNRQIDGLNRDQTMDNVYRASVAAAIARFLAERLKADSDMDWIREVNRRIDGIGLHTPTVENVYADLGETERMTAPAKTGSGIWNRIWAYFFAVFLLLLALEPIGQLYMECKLKWLGTEMEASVANIPVQQYRDIVKWMYVDIGNRSVPVSISGADYARERFKAGQTVTVKYHAASGRATLSGELNWRIIFKLAFLGGLAVAFGIAGYKGRA